MKYLKNAVSIALVLTLLFSFGANFAQAKEGADDPAGDDSRTAVTSVTATNGARMDSSIDALQVAMKEGFAVCAKYQTKDEREKCLIDLKQKFDANIKVQTPITKEIRDRMEASMKIRLDDNSGKISDKTIDRENRIEKHGLKVIERVKATIARITKLADRVEERIKKHESDKKGNVVEARKHLDLARQSLNLASKNTVELEAAFKAALSIQGTNSVLTEFEKCALAGGTVGKSLPRVCDINGQRYVETKTTTDIKGFNSTRFAKFMEILKTIKSELKDSREHLKMSISALK